MPSVASAAHGDGAIARAGPGERPEVRRAAHQHDVEHGVGEVRRMGLRHVGGAARDLGARQLRERRGRRSAPRPPCGREQAEQRLEQGGLAGAVGAEEADDLAGPTARLDVAADRLARDSRSRGASPRASCPARAGRAASSQRKTGAPTKAVRMPSGVSTAAMRARERVDQQQIAGAERASRRGRRRSKFGPTSMRAMCGMIEADPADRRRRSRPRSRSSASRPRSPRCAGARALTPERARLLVAEREHVDPPAQKRQRDEAERCDRDRGRRGRSSLMRGEAAEQPEGDRRQLVVGIGQDLEQRDRRSRRARRPPRRRAPAPAPARAHAPRRRRRSTRRDRAEPDEEGEELDAERRAATGRCRAQRPSPAPADTPRMSGETSGLRNRP